MDANQPLAGVEARPATAILADLDREAALRERLGVLELVDDRQLLSLAFLAWPIRSPNYFYVVDRTLWLWNWSKPGKAVNSSIFAVLLLVTESVAVGLVAGYRGGWVDSLLMRCVDILYGLPYILLIILFAGVDGAGSEDVRVTGGKYSVWSLNER